MAQTHSQEGFPRTRPKEASPAHAPGERGVGHLLKTALEKTLEVFCVGLLLALTVVVLMGVFYRTLGWSLPWYDEVAAIGLCWLSFYGAALAALKRAHMGFAGLVKKMPVPLRAALFVFSEIVVIAFYAIIAWYGYLVLPVVGWDTMASLPSVTMDVVQSVIPISAVLFILCELVSMPQAWRDMQQNRDSEQAEIDAAIEEAQASHAEHGRRS
ncbi:TRAP transporter small permease [Kushneria sp. EE4]